MGIHPLKSETALSNCRRNLFALMAFFFLILITYSNTFDASWQFDDEDNILKNRPLHLTEFKSQNLKKTLFASLDGKGHLYRPIACLSFALNYYFGKHNVFGYHLVNLSIHFLASVFLFLLIFNTLNLPLLKARYGPNAYSIALLATFLWAINPMQTQAVTYIVQRMSSMAGMFYIMAMYFYLKGRTVLQKRYKGICFTLSFFCGILAFASKENTALLPLSILLFDLFLIQGIKRGNLKKNLLLLLILILIPLILGIVLRGPSLFPLKNLFSGYDQRGFTLSERLLTEPRVLFFYSALLLYPMPDRLCVTHDFPLSHNLMNPPQTIIAIMALVALLFFTIIKARRRPFISYCIIFFFLNHLIESSILPLEISFEHRNYLPSMLFFAPFVIFILKGLHLFSNKQTMKFIFTGFIVLILIGQGHSTFVRNMIWKTGESLWLDCMEKYPELLRPYVNLGKYYSDTNQPKKAVIQFRLGLNKRDINNIYDLTYWKNYFNLGIAYVKIGDRERALSNFLKADELFPNIADLQKNIGSLLLGDGRFQEAEERFFRALSYQPDHSKALSNLGTLYMIRGEHDKARALLEKSLEIEPNDIIALKTQIRLFIKLRCFGKALIQAKRLMTLNKTDSLLNQLLLAEIYHASGSRKKLDELLERLVKSNAAIQLQTFLNGFTENRKSIAFLPEKEFVFSFLGEVSRKRAQLYHDMASYCEQKKGELAKPPVPLELNKIP